MNRREPKNGLSPDAMQALEALRDSVPVQNQFQAASRGVWVGGRVYENAFGEKFFLPLGSRRAAIPVTESLSFLGDGQRNVKGWGDDAIRLTNPVRT